MSALGSPFRVGAAVSVMGIVNATPDSFSGDGHMDPGVAVEHGLRLVAEGADLLDVGGESTRPGHVPVDAGEEARRVIPVVRRLASEAGVPISIDTSKASVARAALAAGATIVNDVWGLLQSPEIASIVAEHGAGLVVMHNQLGNEYSDLMGEVVAHLQRSVARALAAGVDGERLAVDPGIGFGKTAEQNLEVLRRLDSLRSLGLPILVGVSRKSFIGRILDSEPADRVEGTAAAVVAGILRGADIVRVHDVGAIMRHVRMAEVLR